MIHLMIYRRWNRNIFKIFKAILNIAKLIIKRKILTLKVRNKISNIIQL